MSKKGERAPQHSKEEKIELAMAVCALYESQGCTLESACKSVGMSDRLFRYWVATVSEVSELYKKAKTKSVEIYWDRLRDKAQDGLEKLVSGFDERQTVVEDVYWQGVACIDPETGKTAKKTKETKAHVAPNVGAVIFALKGEYPDRFADRAKTQSTINVIEGLNEIPLEKRLAAMAALETVTNGS